MGLENKNRVNKLNIEKLKFWKQPNKEDGFDDAQASVHPDFLSLGSPFAYLILNHKKVIAAGGFLQKYIEIGRLSRIPDIVPTYDPQLKKQPAILGDQTYILYTRHFDAGLPQSPDRPIDDYSAVFFVEASGMATTNDEAVRTFIGLIFIDNYEEATDGMDEARRPLLAALIDRKLGVLAQQVNGIIRKFEKDKYIFIFSEDKLEYLKEKKFDILAQMREIEMGNHIPVTLSIGVGINGNTLAQNMESSRAAVDLALGRGGDQAVIKDSDKYTFFGGVSKENVVNARVRARVKAYAFSELVSESDRVIVLGHKNIDLDCLGAAVGVCKIANSMSRECRIVIGEVTTSVKLLYDALVESESYGKAFISADKAATMLTRQTLIVVVDTHRNSYIEGSEILDLPHALKIVVFDHHRKAAEFIENAVLAYHEPYASSTCELVTEMLQYVREDIDLTGLEADALLAGITIDTKNFSIKTGAKTFEAAAFLRRNGADSLRVKALLKNDLASFRAKATAINNAFVIHENIAMSVCGDELENPSLTAAQTADELLNIYGIEASFVLCRSNKNIYISARSLDNINVQVIMEKLGGGGHQTVAGAQLSDVDIEQAAQMTRDALNQYIEEES